MRRKQVGFYSWLMNSLSSFYRHLLTIGIVSLGYVVLGWVVFSGMNTRLDFIHGELAGLQYQEDLRQFLLGVYTHKYLVQRYYQGNIALKNQILQVQKEANEDLRNFEKVNLKLQNSYKELGLPAAALIEQAYEPQEIDKDWKKIRTNIFSINLIRSNELHDKLIRHIDELLNYSGNISNLTQDPSFVIYQMIESSTGLLPNLQSSISNMMNIVLEMYQQQKMTPSQHDELIGLVYLIDRDLDEVKNRVSRVLSTLTDTPKLRDAINQAFAGLYESAGQLLSDVREKIKTGTLETSSPTKLQNLASQTINDSFVLWDQVSMGIEQILENREDSIERERVIILSISIVIILAGFLLGAYFVAESTKTLKSLKETAYKISKGDLSARVPVKYHDELGKVCLVFNHMAKTLEWMMHQFRQLLKTTQTLAKGDFSARLAVDPAADEEIKAVGFTFNRMAETLEEVVAKLHRLVIELTSSATQIEASSKQHEASITEQGSTTKQISVTATEISATSKDFAKTMSEVSGAAEETARLARLGQSNLGKMETAMMQMEAAASNIASKLAVLNEKAGNITTVITTISDVSAQTNLLSLNAAIEAEKAGQAGRSFAVIAREIRGLSDQTARSTFDIERIVNEIIEAVKSSVVGVDDFTQEIREGAQKVKGVGEQLGQIMEQVKTLVDRFEAVDDGMKTQSDAAEQINKALIDLSGMANETSISMGQFHTTIKQLSLAASGLREVLEKIKQ